MKLLRGSKEVIELEETLEDDGLEEGEHTTTTNVMSKGILQWIFHSEEDHGIATVEIIPIPLNIS